MADRADIPVDEVQETLKPATRAAGPRRDLISRAASMVRYVYRKLFKTRHEPHHLALGFSVGAFIGIFPTFGLGLIAIMGLAAIWKFHVPAAIAGTLLANPLLGPFWMFLSYRVGDWVLGGFSKDASKLLDGWLKKALSIGVNYMVGNLIISAVIGVIAYFVIYFLVHGYRSLKLKKTKFPS